MIKDPEDTTAPTESSSHDLPTGYTFQHAHDGSHFAMPEFLVTATNMAFDAHHMKTSLNIDDVSTEVCVISVISISSSHKLSFAGAVSIAIATQYTWLASVIHKCQLRHGSCGPKLIKL
ncbi:hypothetical protein BYT27DRAFT_7251252 [Phlegmacium glaucopus]|nr:hypothetical protein BYT27DRAFT_7251252 [Phlegmacium glaucopus]